jgi:hypothetical protein
MKRTRLALIVFLLAACAPQGYEKAAEACRNIRSGMTEEQVLAVMGAPQRRATPSNHPGDLWLVYSEGGDIRPLIVVLTRSGDTFLVAKDGSCGA